MDTFRHGLALLLVVVLPPALGFWLLVHPFARFWRRLGPGWTYAAVWPPLVAAMFGLYRVRESLLRIDLGTSWPLVVLAVACFCGAAVMFRALRRELSVRIQSGWPELSRDPGPGLLLTQGIYARIRHPRYVEFWLGLLAWALIANHLASWMVVAAALPLLWMTAILEERELHERFGAAYQAYCQRVPRFWPRRRL